MKRSIGAVVLCCLTISFGARPALSQGDLTGEAVRLCKEQLDKHWLQRGDDWFTIAVASLSSLGTVSETSPRSLIQMRGSLIEPQISKLTEADKLNGVDWKGAIRLTAKAGRAYLQERGWGEWNSYVSNFGLNMQLGWCALTHKKGTWILENYIVGDKTTPKLYLRPAPEKIPSSQ